MLQTLKKYPICVSFSKGLDAVSVVQPLINTKSGFNIMGKRINYQNGQVINDLILIRETKTYISSTNRKTRMGLFKCKCGNEFNVAINSIRNCNTKSCGCYNVKRAIETNITHGLSRTPLYRIWADMKTRCYNSNDRRYKYYGGRNIRIYNDWIIDYKKYYDYIIKLENYNDPKYPSLDRINNSGNYEPGNMRWTSYHIQSTNRELQKNNTSGFRGVHKTSKNRWQAGIQINGKLVYLGLFDTPQKANIKRREYIIEHKLFEYK